ncbi:aldehyde dehydrogenase [Lentzea sp. NPDC058450]|uniref:aldehyde dehydrogenase n=1 Tax=Lentzea sp. NPDC058450 TaxID=3346505 RepID=UPI0036641F39
MARIDGLPSALKNADRLYIDGEWATPSSSATVEIIDASTELSWVDVAVAQEADMARAIGAARQAFDRGPWPRLRPAQRAEYLRRIAQELRDRESDVGQIWPRESGVVQSTATAMAAGAGFAFDFYADMASTFEFDEPVRPAWGGEYGIIAHEPVGVVGAIVPWNAPLGLMVWKVAPALLAGCTVVVKSAREAPGDGYLLAEAAMAAGLPAGVLNVVTAADRSVSEQLVRDPRVDKIAFTGSTAAGRRIGSILGERLAHMTLELGGKSAAVVLDDYDLESAAKELALHQTNITGQFCASLSRIIVTRSRHDEFVEALAHHFGAVRVGDPFDQETQMGPLAMAKQRDKVAQYVARGVEDGATLATGGGLPAGLDRGFYFEPTVFGNVDNSSTIAQEEIFGPVLAVVPADDEDHAVELANDSIYGLNSSVFTNDHARGLDVARRLQAGTVGHNAYRGDFTMSFGGVKQSGIGREGGRVGLNAFLDTKSIILTARPDGFPELGA